MAKFQKYNLLSGYSLLEVSLAIAMISSLLLIQQGLYRPIVIQIQNQIAKIALMSGALSNKKSSLPNGFSWHNKDKKVLCIKNPEHQLICMDQYLHITSQPNTI